MFAIMMVFGQNDNARFVIIDEQTQKMGFIDKNGNVVIEPVYDNVEMFSDGISKVELEDKTGYIDIDGNLIVSFIYDELGLWNEDVIHVELDGKNGFVNKIWKILKNHQVMLFFDVFINLSK